MNTRILFSIALIVAIMLGGFSSALMVLMPPASRLAHQWAVEHNVVNPAVTCKAIQCVVTGDNFEGDIKLDCNQGKCQSEYEQLVER